MAQPLHLRPFFPLCLTILCPVVECLVCKSEARHISDSHIAVWVFVAISTVLTGWYAATELRDPDVFDSCICLAALYVAMMECEGKTHTIIALVFGVSTGLGLIGLTVRYLPVELVPLECLFAPVYLAYLFGWLDITGKWTPRPGWEITTFAVLEHVTAAFVCCVLLLIPTPGYVPNYSVVDLMTSKRT